MKIVKAKLITLLALICTMGASAQYAGIYSGTVVDTTYNDPNAGTFAVFIGTNGQANVVGYDVDSFQNSTSGQAGGVAAQFNVPANGNWSFSSNNTIYGCSGSGLVTNGAFSGTLNFTNGDAVLLTNGYQQSPLGNFQNAAGYYSGTFSGTFGGQALSGPLISVLSANGQITFSVFINGSLNDGGQAQLGPTNQFITTNLTSGSVVSGMLTNATLKIGGAVTNSYGKATFTMSRSNYVFQVATTNLPNGVTTVPYNQTLAAYGGPTNYTWGIASGGLPAGLTLSVGGVISGTPTTAGNTNLTVRATNALSATATQVLSLSIYSFSSAVTFAVTPTVVSNTYLGTITLLTSNLASGETVVVQKYLDLNTNGVIDGNDMLVQQFNLTDGQAGMVIGGVTNLNVPGDLNTAVSNITTTFNFNNGDFMQNLVGKYLYKLSSPIGHFAPLTNSFTVTNFPFLQKFTGNVVSNSTSTTLSNAIVLLFPPPRAGHSGPGGNPLAGGVANNAGAYSIAAPAGTYTLTAFFTNYVTSFKNAPVLTLTNNATFNTNLTATVATTNITGRMVDAANNNLGLPGVFMPVDSTNGLIAISCTDANGNFNIRVSANNLWKLGSSGQGLIVHGYVGWSNGIYTNSGATNVVLAYPLATALFYGSVKDNLGNPMAGIDVNDYDTSSNLYSMDGYTDTNGNYFVGALGLGSNDPWQLSFSGESTPTNYVFTQPLFDQNGGTNLTAGQAVLQNFTGILATSLITGKVKFNGTNIVGVGVWASGNGSVSNYSQFADTDTNGNYSLSVPNGTWTVGLNINGGNDSLDGILGSGTYQQPNTQNAVINNNNSTNNFNVLPCGGVVFVTASPLSIGEVNAFYNQSIQASDCSGNYSWSQTGGTLPGNLNLYSGGQFYTLTGYPTNSGTFTFTVQVNDGNNSTNSQQFSVTISNALQITTSSLPNGTNGSPYSRQLQAAGGQPPYTNWFLYSGSLPANLNLSASGLISGTAVTSGTFNFTVGLFDVLGGTNTQPLTLTLNNTNAATPPPMGVTSANGQVLIYYPTSGSNFVLQTATNLNGPWVTASNGVPAISYYFTNNAPVQFYRLQ